MALDWSSVSTDPGRPIRRRTRRSAALVLLDESRWQDFLYRLARSSRNHTYRDVASRVTTPMPTDSALRLTVGCAVTRVNAPS